MTVLFNCGSLLKIHLEFDFFKRFNYLVVSCLKL